MITWRDHLSVEQCEKQRVDFKMIHVDMAGDLIAGLMLSQLIYWHSFTKKGKLRLRVNRYGHFWVAKAHGDWWEECRLSADQARRGLGILIKRGLIVTEVHRFNGSPTTHIRIEKEAYMEKYRAVLLAADDSVLVPSPVPPGPQPRYLTKNTTEITSVSAGIPADTSTEKQSVEECAESHCQPEMPALREELPFTDLPVGEEKEVLPAKTKNVVRAILERHFSTQMKIRVPTTKTAKQRKAAAVRWWGPIREIAKIADWDERKGKGLIDAALTRMEGLTISAPQSILQTVIAISGERARVRLPQTRASPDIGVSVGPGRRGV